MVGKCGDEEGAAMVEKFLLATAVTFALNLFLGFSFKSAPPQAQAIPPEQLSLEMPNLTGTSSTQPFTLNSHPF